MLGWMEKCRKQTALALNIPAIIATTAFAIVQNHDASSLAGMAGMRVAALISVALPHIARLKKAKLVEDKLQKYAANLASAVLATATVVTAYAWGAALTDAELAIVGLATVINACIDAFVPESTVVEKLLKDIDALQSDAASNVTADSQEVVTACIKTLTKVKIKICDRHGIAHDQAERKELPVRIRATAEISPSSPARENRSRHKHKAKSHSPLHRKSKQEGAAEFKTTPFRATHVRSMVAPAIARTHR